MIRLIVGLGNPGPSYEYTRHNLGARVALQLAEDQQWPLKAEKKVLGRVAKGLVASAMRYILIPTTYMNESGDAVARFVRWHRIEADEVLVLMDDVALPFGKLRLKPKGSSGGHNGLEDILRVLGSVSRLRIGVGSKRPLKKYVLNLFTREEEERLGEIIDRAVSIVEMSLEAPLEEVMRRANAKEEE